MAVSRSWDYDSRGRDSSRRPWGSRNSSCSIPLGSRANETTGPRPPNVLNRLALEDLTSDIEAVQHSAFALRKSCPNNDLLDSTAYCTRCCTEAALIPAKTVPMKGGAGNKKPRRDLQWSNRRDGLTRFRIVEVPSYLTRATRRSSS